MIIVVLVNCISSWLSPTICAYPLLTIVYPIIMIWGIVPIFYSHYITIVVLCSTFWCDTMSALNLRRLYPINQLVISHSINNTLYIYISIIRYIYIYNLLILFYQHFCCLTPRRIDLETSKKVNTTTHLRSAKARLWMIIKGHACFLETGSVDTLRRQILA